MASTNNKRKKDVCDEDGNELTLMRRPKIKKIKISSNDPKIKMYNDIREATQKMIGKKADDINKGKISKLFEEFKTRFNNNNNNDDIINDINSNITNNNDSNNTTTTTTTTSTTTTTDYITINTNTTDATMAEEINRLPIYKQRKLIKKEIKDNDSLVLVGETGSGKTTQVPKFVFQANINRYKCIAVTQPRRVAAISLAKRVAVELGTELGDMVGYRVRFDNVTSKNTKIIFMTDGMLLREALLDLQLMKYNVVILDEAHERSIDTDILFGIVKSAQLKRSINSNDGDYSSSPLKVIVMSATMNVQKFSKYFNGAKIINIQGRLHKIEKIYAKGNSDYVGACVDMVLKIHTEKPINEDILVFLTGQEEIEKAIQLLLWKRQSSIYENSAVIIPLPFYTALPPDELNKVFELTPPGMRKVVFSTTLAETSLTIRGIKYVVDCGKAKVRTFDPVSGLELLKVRVTSQAQANQRAGRAGRESDGICYRMYSREKFDTMKKTSVPEIKRTNLSSVILQLLYCGINDVISFDFLDKPKPEALEKGLQMLKWLDAIVDDDDDGGGKKLYKLTAVGKQMVKFPLLPQYSKIIINANSYGCLPEILNIISMLSADNILIDVLNKRNEIRQNRSVLEDNSGDLITYLRIFSEYKKVFDKEKWCKKYYINERSMKVAADIKEQLKQLCIQEGFKMVSKTGRDYDTIVKCLCAGLFMNYARHTVDRFLTNDSQEAKIHPSSFLAKQGNAGANLIFCELVHSNEVYMRYVSNVHPDWVKNAAPVTYEFKKIVQPDSDDVKRRGKNRKMGLRQ